ncbi:MAG: phytanoyl-CoA dioxygenase family protein [Armatimonadetes bacterium]|nr:phytanoyl-CoA dioxygenase family protein [Armatimonadota bacterium]MDW8122115.1 phytanoyl-CoA dioxygenase family protein [Armatimonadota bacterium]
MGYRLIAESRPDRYPVTVEQYRHYQKYGYLIVRDLVPQEEVEELKGHAMDLFYGRVDIPGVEKPEAGSDEDLLAKRFTRVHMLHRVDAMAERFLLHPRILDVLEALIGPDVLALQTMLFFNPPGKGGQGWHQDAYYITTYPDTLIGSWLALDRADEENGCLWVAPGSQVEPIYPTPGAQHGFVHSDGAIADLPEVENVSNLDDDLNTLSPIAKRYESVPVVLEPGDVVFFHGHLLHRSYSNRTKDRWRRAFVSHYCNARSWVPWNHGIPYEGDSANYCHILARGRTHLPFAKPRFGTPCAALNPPEAVGVGAVRMMGMDGEMKPVREVSAFDPGPDAWRTRRQ